MNSQVSLINPKSVRYVKLGEGGEWEAECIKKGILRIGFHTGRGDVAELCRNKDWKSIKLMWQEKEGKSPSVATRFANEVKYFVEDAGDTLWITFVQDRLYWCFLEPGMFSVYGNDIDSYRTTSGGWRCEDIDGHELTKPKLSGVITAIAARRGTSSAIIDDVRDRIIGRINAKKDDRVETALSARVALEDALIPLIKKLRPPEFEDLVGIIFSSSGWRRLGRVGGTQKTVDIELMLPSTQEHAFVQVKSSTTQKEFERYISSMDQMSVNKMFFVYHTGKIKACNDESVILIDGRQVAKMSIDAGLADWVIDKAS